MIHKIKSKQEFNNEIETLVFNGGYSYLQAIFKLAEKYNLDEDILASLLEDQLKDKLKVESVRNNMFRGKKRNRKLKIK